ncbi:MAG TPA: biotin transporter BioY [Pyrinomonadaceae bacterium]|jgi:biotin transport system substrate-specific component
MNTYAKAETLTGAWLAPAHWVKSITLVVAFSLFIALSAQVVVPLPFTPVPITLQTFAVLLTGALLGSRLGAAALLLYLVEGASGLPFFRGGNGGALYLAFSPTAGYLLAYPVAAFVTGWLAERGWDRKFLTAAAAIGIGSIIVLFGGWLGLLRFYAAGQAFALGVAPFVVGDIVKIALAAAVLPSGWALLRKKG